MPIVRCARNESMCEVPKQIYCNNTVDFTYRVGESRKHSAQVIATKHYNLGDVCIYGTRLHSRPLNIAFMKFKHEVQNS